MKSAEYTYLEFINELASGETSGMYGIEDMRVSLHEEVLISSGLEEYYSKTKEIMGNLDKAIGFKPPLMRGDNLKPYAEELRRLLSCTECKYYMSGKIQALNTKYGRLNNGKWEEV